VRPLIELHSHLEGTMDAATLLDLASGGREHLLPTADVNELTRMISMPGLEGFTEYFRISRPFRTSIEDIKRFTRVELEHARSIGVVYAEYRFNPMGPAKRGADPWEILVAIDAEMRSMQIKTGFQSVLIAGLARPGDKRELDAFLELAETAWQDGLVCAIDLNGDEEKYPTRDFIGPLSRVAARGCPVIVHAGEWAGPESVCAALECGASRIGHGIRAAEDDDLVNLLAREGITLEVCPTSNVFTEVYRRIEGVPLRKLFDAGVAVTVNSDDGAAFGSDVAQEYAVAEEVLGFSKDETARMLQNAVAGAFLPKAVKRILTRRIAAIDTEN